MSIEYPTKDKKKDKKENKKSPKEHIPESLEDIKVPEEKAETEVKHEEKKEIVPPTPVTLRGSTERLRPTRLPPKFRHKTVLDNKALNDEKNIIKEEDIVKAPQEDEKKAEVTTQSKREIKKPVTIRSRRPIPSPEGMTRTKTTKVMPTRIELPEEDYSPQKIDTSQLTIESVEIVSQEEILSQFNASTILLRPKETGWPWVKSKRINIPQGMQTYWRAEASLYAAIAMLHFLTIAHEKGEMAPEVYSKQLKSQLMEAIQLRFKLEKDDRFEWEAFVNENQIEEYFPEGLEKLARVTGSSDIDEAIEDETVQLDYTEIKKLPTKAADFVADAIELMDLIRLQSIATVERLIPLLEDLRKILLQSRKILGEDYWVIKEIDAWVKSLYQQEPGTIPTEQELERLEMQVVRWLNDFRRELKDI